MRGDRPASAASESVLIPKRINSPVHCFAPGGERIASYYSTSDMKVLVGGIKKDLYDRFDLQQLLSDNRLLDEQIVEDVLKIIR